MCDATAQTGEKRARVGRISEQFPYARILPNDKQRPDAITDSLFYSTARGIIFPVNIFELPKDDPWFHELEEKVYPWAVENDLELRFIEMRGASSPEGPIKWNNTLAENRSKALRNRLQKVFHVDYNLVDSSVIGNPEDYRALLYMMKQEKDPDYEYVKSVLEKHNWNRVTEKEELKAARGGKLWKRLLEEYYPKIRYARVLLYFTPRNKKMQIEHLIAIPIDYPQLPQIEWTPIAGQLIEEEDTDISAWIDYPRKHILALRSNILYDALYFPRYGFAPSPNLQLEYYPNKGRITYNASITYPDWEHYNTQKFWQIHDYNLGVRYYTRKDKVAPKDALEYMDEIGDYFQGFFVGAYVNAGRYGIGLNDNDGWEGEYAGGGLQVGYTLPLSQNHRWRLEFTASAGLLFSKYDPYVWGNPISGDIDGLYYYDWVHSAEQFIKRNHHFTWFGPTEVGVHLTYDLLYRRGHGKKGVSFNRWYRKGGRR